MKISVLGGGFYGCHIARELISSGNDVTIYEQKSDIFLGASGNIPARLHLGYHYPRSYMTRESCQAHNKQFMEVYGEFTRWVKYNLYAIAKDESLVDYEQYTRTLEDELFFTQINPSAYNLENVEGAILTDERHIVVDDLRSMFRDLIGQQNIVFNYDGDKHKDADVIIDCTFCAGSSIGVDRYEPCIVGQLSGPTDTAVTIMDGPFSSLYPWNEELGLCSISSALFSPITKTCKSYEEAKTIVDGLPESDAIMRVQAMVDDLAKYYPPVSMMKVVGAMRSVRAMPLSGADARIARVTQDGATINVMAGKIDAVFYVYDQVRGLL